ncbi:MAG: hypothetical protein HXY20_03985 [Acidobacteria bacterium]|nr:hypothetical protein [Acidobacteriota bacterium]
MKWPGDIDSDSSTDRGLPSIIRTQSAAGLAGFAFWGFDVPGYGRNASKVLAIRRLQQGVFSPLLQIVERGTTRTRRSPGTRRRRTFPGPSSTCA